MLRKDPSPPSLSAPGADGCASARIVGLDGDGLVLVVPFLASEVTTADRAGEPEVALPPSAEFLKPTGLMLS